MRCGTCKKSGDDITIAHVKGCQGVGPDGTAGAAGSRMPRDRSTAPQWPASEPQIKYVLGLQAERNLPDWWPVRTREDLVMMNRDEVSDDIGQLKTFTKNAKSSDVYKPTMPAGRYALHESVSGSLGIGPMQWRFYQVDDGKGRWTGYKFIKRLIGSPGDYQKNPVPASDRDRLFRMIEDDPQKAMIDYGLQSKTCGKCGSALSDPTSIARGIGPHCAAKLGW